MPASRDQRRSHRVRELKPTRIRLKGRHFMVSDISNSGIGIILEDDGPPFVVGERLEDVPIPLENGTVNVQGIVSHISVTTAGRTCGIHFIFRGAEYDAVIRFIQERTLDPKGKESA